MPPPTQRWTRPSATANVRIVSASSKSPFALDRPERAHRRAAADRLEPRDVVERGDLRRAGDRAAGERRAQDLGERRVRRAAAPRRSRRGASRRRARAGAISSGQRTEPGSQTRERSLRSRSTIITCSAASFASSTSSPSGRVPLIGIVTSRSPRRARKSSGDAETIAQPSPASGAACSGRSGASAAASARGSPRERRREVLHEVHLVDVAARDRRAHRVDRRRVVVGAQVGSHSPTPKPTLCGRPHERSDRSRGEQRQRGTAPAAAGHVVAAQRLAEAVAEEDVGDAAVARSGEVLLERLERARRLVELEHRSTADGCAPRGAASARRARGRRPARARPPSGSAARRSPGPSPATGRSRTRRCRTPRASSASR